MQPFSLRRSAFLAVVTAFVVPAAFAQTTAPPAGNTPPPAGSPLTSVVAFGQPTAADKKLLQQAVARYQTGQGKGGFRTVSELMTTLEGKGISATIKETVRVSSQEPRKFRSEVLIQPPGSSKGPIRYEIVSDGTHQYTYRADTQQYAVESPPTKGNSNFFATGMLQAMVAGGKSHSRIGDIDRMTKDGGKIMTGSQTHDGKNYRVFQIQLPGSGAPVITLYIESPALQIAEISFKGASPSTNITAMEHVVQIEKVTGFPVDTFVFAPPKGAKKVAKIDITHFN